MTKREDRFRYQDPRDNELQVYIVTDGSERGLLGISVSDDTGYIHLPIEVAKQLRDYLDQVLV
jgi:hypothetical protein